MNEFSKQFLLSKNGAKQGFVDNQNKKEKNVEKIFENVLTMKIVFGIITKSLVTKARTTTSKKKKEP